MRKRWINVSINLWKNKQHTKLESPRLTILGKKDSSFNKPLQDKGNPQAICQQYMAQASHQEPRPWISWKKTQLIHRPGLTSYAPHNTKPSLCVAVLPLVSLRSTPYSNLDKKSGHLYFGEKRTFLLWVDSKKATWEVHIGCAYKDFRFCRK